MEGKLEATPTWVIAVVCFIIVAISLTVERLIHYLGKYLKRKNQKPLFQALQKIKEELMLLGFISLLLTVLQGPIQKMCIPESPTHHMLPCKRESESSSSSSTTHYSLSGFIGVGGGMRRVLGGEGSGSDYCTNKGKVPLLSVEALHELHIFIFVLATVHVTFCATTMILGGFKVSFVKQFSGSVTKSDYATLRLGFVMKHCGENQKFDFYKFMMRVLEADFRKVVGISWYLWVFVVIFLLLNVNGWHVYFWIAFIPLILLLAVGTKLEHIIIQLAHEVVEKHAAIEGDLVVKPSDDLFWFHRPRIVLFLIHLILFQNAFEIAFFFWILCTYGFNSCIMGQVGFVIPRLVIGVIVQILCSYSTLPLYAIVTQMGSSFKKEIFEEHVQVSLADWARSAKNKGGLRVFDGQIGSKYEVSEHANEIQLQNVEEQDEFPRMEEGNRHAV
ncbi:MLO-like protein 1 [Acorus gramineus]|uniref:MLO-like protein n=1 Tax=Acorus gramineus TaxID=55184 RepID=A0AAV9AS90_ACOGR|nr:MLO-like protein 1 [Acorus gramineus]